MEDNRRERSEEKKHNNRWDEARHSAPQGFEGMNFEQLRESYRGISEQGNRGESSSGRSAPEGKDLVQKIFGKNAFDSDEDFVDRD